MPYHRHVSQSTTHALATSEPVAVAYQRWLPNALTGLRLVIAATFFVLLATWNYPARDLLDPKISPLRPLWPYLIEAALFGLAAVTDAIDGPLARRWKVVSKFGRIMDPFADKVLVVGAFIMLSGPTFGVDIVGQPPFQVSGIMSWMVVIILGRELLVTSMRAVAESDGHDFSADWAGKAKMVVQACAIPFILVMLGITEVHRGTPGRFLIDGVAWLTVVVTALSAWTYVRRAVTLSRA